MSEEDLEQAERADKARWIFRSGLKGLCPQCGKASMFRKWLKLRDTCPSCGLDYAFAAPDDGPAFFSLCIVAFPLTFIAVWLQAAFEPPFWVHLVTSLPLLVIGCIWPLQYIKGWLVASQYVNKAQEAGTESLWAELNDREAQMRKNDRN
ncbi:DUF983 domain-containing protein [Croceicoccus naphthovorans]|uniref:Uncharacterized protein n=1 Tax=Croceicoccus naphthovorans TaxID=1348774 RepID=A0A0G3XG12_9SPHN|nr:DUF983 domain-containing protein [Croceicoccus naphthovorans]AKM09556.1 hypothetical protein AB433_05520 [Croceicoccus naphthovorans]MBB3989681.1 uncharacterized protein (DUF983 family) [Croceicoccus naphthovorans]